MFDSKVSSLSYCDRIEVARMVKEECEETEDEGYNQVAKLAIELYSLGLDEEIPERRCFACLQLICDTRALHS
jgi:hypothetical protein